MHNKDADGSGEHTADDSQARRIGRREFVSGAAAGTVAGPMVDALAAWAPAFRIDSASAQATCALPAGFPANIPLYQQAYANWSGEIRVSSLWTCAPKTPADVLAVVNWAASNGYQARPRGMLHNWSPLTIAAGDPCAAKLVLLDTTQYLAAVSIDTMAGTVTAQTGVTMEALLTLLESAGLGLTAAPAPGDVTLGGVLAIGAHGTAVPVLGEQAMEGHSHGSLSNLVRSVTAVVWDAGSSQYVLRKFQRTDPDCRAFLPHLGRSFITEVTLQTGANQRLRCQSFFDIPAAELFAPAGSSGHTFASYVEKAGRVEAIWFPFTDTPWLKTWTVSPSKPWTSRAVTSPYNYPFSDDISQAESDLVSQIVGGDPAVATAFGPLQFAVAAAGLVTTFSFDLWGWSKNLLLYIKPTTLRVTANGYAVITSRSNIQRVVNDFFTAHQARIAAYQAAGKYPMNGPVEIRVTGLDQPADIGLAGAGAGQLSAVRPRPDHPEWDVAVWFDNLTIPGTPNANAFFRETEQWMMSHYSGSYAAVRPEWSKGWAYTSAAAWSDPTMLSTNIPAAYRAGQATDDNWDVAISTLDRFDPHRVFSSPLLDALLP